MSDSVESQVVALKAEAEAATTRQQKLVAQAEAAEADHARLLVKLAEDFNVSSVEEAEALAVKLEEELRAEIARVRTALESARG